MVGSSTRVNSKKVPNNAVSIPSRKEQLAFDGPVELQLLNNDISLPSLDKLQTQLSNAVNLGHGLNNTLALGNNANVPTQPKSASLLDSPRGLAKQGSSSRGGVLPDALRSKMESAFGSDFSDVRVHEGTNTSQFGAAAYSQGNDIHFASGQYDPSSHKGQLLIAHELTHIVQQQNAPLLGSSNLKRVSQRKDAAEIEAEGLAEKAASGQSVHVSATPSAEIHCGLWDWVEEKASGAVDWVSNTASDTWEGLSETASSTKDWISDTTSDAWNSSKATASDATNGIQDTFSDVWEGGENIASNLYEKMQKGSANIRTGEKWFNEQVDKLQEIDASAAYWLAEQTNGIPGLDPIADATAIKVDELTQMGAGVAKGAGSMVSGIANTLVNPVDTLKGLYEIGESSIKGDFSWTQGIVEPYQEAIKNGKPHEATGRLLFDIGSMFIGGAGAAAKGAGVTGSAAKGISAAGKAAKTTNAIRKSAKKTPPTRLMQMDDLESSMQWHKKLPERTPETIDFDAIMKRSSSGKKIPKLDLDSLPVLDQVHAPLLRSPATSRLLNGLDKTDVKYSKIESRFIELHAATGGKLTSEYPSRIIESLSSLMDGDLRDAILLGTEILGEHVIKDKHLKKIRMLPALGLATDSLQKLKDNKDRE